MTKSGHCFSVRHPAPAEDQINLTGSEWSAADLVRSPVLLRLDAQHFAAPPACRQPRTPRRGAKACGRAGMT